MIIIVTHLTAGTRTSPKFYWSRCRITHAHNLFWHKKHFNKTLSSWFCVASVFVCWKKNRKIIYTQVRVLYHFHCFRFVYSTENCDNNVQLRVTGGEETQLSFAFFILDASPMEFGNCTANSTIYVTCFWLWTEIQSAFFRGGLT